jgi:hypothetical protein
VDLKSIEAWVSHKLFSVLVGDFSILANDEIDKAIKDLCAYARKIGKDEVVFCTNIEREKLLLQDINWDVIDDKIRVMIYPLDTDEISVASYSFNYSDIDTF